MTQRSSIALAGMILALAACGGGGGGGDDGGGGSPPPTQSTFKIGGTMSGLPEGSQAILWLGKAHLIVSANGAFSGNSLPDGSTYSALVTDSDRHCVVDGGTGVVSGADVTSIKVDCHRGAPWVTDGEVRQTMLSPDGRRLYLNGDFRRVGRSTGSFVPVDGASGNALVFRHVVPGAVSAAIGDGHGGYFAAYVPPVFRGGELPEQTLLIHIGSDGFPSPTFRPSLLSGFGVIHALALDGDRLFVGGAFGMISGEQRRSLAAVDTTTGAVTEFKADLEGTLRFQVHALTVADGKLYVGGDFSAVGGVPASNLAAIDLQTDRVTGYPAIRRDEPGASGAKVVRAVAVANGWIYVGGDFNEVSGYLRHGLVALDTLNGLVGSWDPGAPADSVFESLAVSGSVVHVGGKFTSLQAAPRTGIAAVRADTGAPTSWAPTLESAPGSTPEVKSLVVKDGTVYFAGGFAKVNGAARGSLAAVSASTGGLLPFAANAIDQGASVLVDDGAGLWVGGSFSVYGGVKRSGLAAIDLESGQATAWAPKPTFIDGNGDENMGTIDFMQAADSAVALAGSFDRMGGQERYRLALVDSSTGAPLDFDARLPVDASSVTALATDGDTFYVGGNFASFGGASPEQPGGRFGRRPDLAALGAQLDPAGDRPGFRREPALRHRGGRRGSLRPCARRVARVAAEHAGV